MQRNLILSNYKFREIASKINSNEIICPKNDKFYMPAEWEKHNRGCWLAWPYTKYIWRKNAKPIQDALVLLAQTISQFEPVSILVTSREWRNARSKLPPTDSIRLIEITYDDIWLRDIAPTFLVSKETNEIRAVEFDFNGWGNKCEHYNDKLVRAKILDIERTSRYIIDLAMEGGSFHVDGQGTLITTEECLLNTNRNPNLSKIDIENVLMAYLGVSKVIWLPFGVYNDLDTNGHIDNLCCFLKPGVIALIWTDDVNDPQYTISTQAFKILSEEHDAQGRKLKIIKLHQPTPIHRTIEDNDLLKEPEFRPIGERLAASYVNFYFAGNSTIIMPAFGDEYFDNLAVSTLQNELQDYKIINLPIGREILLGGGNIHCITQQQP
eukprot:TRINITY_DN367_c5_g1_i1.p1 TRINITY_DN367_c5_g1~~TRINITY_DN367_c5_g1_i1.p1  ORF type:complete len:381 (-),score=168.78 TRINITY_DN367_c5_g1_i1:81-1223(-)